MTGIVDDRSLDKGYSIDPYDLRAISDVIWARPIMRANDAGKFSSNL